MTDRELTNDTPGRAYRYHQLRAAIEQFQCNMTTLDETQRAQVDRLARQTFALEELVLSSSEARDTHVPEPRLEESMATLRERYPDESAFEEDLERNGLDIRTIRQALQRELVFDAVMQRIGALAAAVTEEEAQTFYTEHHERFAYPERRLARHILITINEEYEENRREVARARIERIAAELNGQTEHFEELAHRHSECPTAAEGGRLGTVAAGTLYPQLDTALFSLEAGEISGVLESELGFHILWCEGIEPATELAFEQIRPKITAALTKRRQAEAQKRWLAELRANPPQPREHSAS